MGILVVLDSRILPWLGHGASPYLLVKLLKLCISYQLGLHQWPVHNLPQRKAGLSLELAI